MTSAPVPLAEQPTTDLQFVERHLHRCENEWKKVYPPYEQDDIDREIACFRRVLATLQQHERGMAALREPSDELMKIAEVAYRGDGWDGSMRAVFRAAAGYLAALDAAANIGAINVK